MIGLLGNPNVGKSTVFNRLTGMRQHTGNWPGKTVAVARGHYTWAGEVYRLIDLPGTYSLAARSQEEALACDYILSGECAAVCVVCDATCLVRSLPLLLQALEITGNVVACVNLMDEAAKRGIAVDAAALSQALGVPVVAMSARDGEGADALMAALAKVCEEGNPAPALQRYAPAVERAIEAVEQRLTGDNRRWRALREVEQDETLEKSIVASLYLRAEALCEAAVTAGRDARMARQLGVDRLLTGRALGIPVMLALLALVFYITIVGASAPSMWLSRAFTVLERLLSDGLTAAGAPWWLTGALVDGVFKVTAWVVAVMLPPMAIFFPLFTLLEDLGYLPRVAFNLDPWFRRCRGCGKQALTMLMGFGCNAAGVTGCRIIDSPRERLIAILTNALVPCNGRFPLLILLLSLYAAGGRAGAALPALLLTALVALGVGATLVSARLLSGTLLKGMPSSFALELPPYRMPQVGKVLVRSLFDRTVHVLGRALLVAAPFGLVLWALGNLKPGGVDLLQALVRALDPAGRALGMDGVMLSAFILGLPANELVLPMALMLYRSAGVLAESGAAAEVGAVLAAGGWTTMTAVCAMLFTLFHWPCATTLLTVRKETGSVGWTLVALVLPTLIGAVLCALVSAIWRCFV